MTKNVWRWRGSGPNSTGRRFPLKRSIATAAALTKDASLATAMYVRSGRVQKKGMSQTAANATTTRAGGWILYSRPPPNPKKGSMLLQALVFSVILASRQGDLHPW